MSTARAVKGKIVLVPFPFDDLSTTKVRPAVCLTNPFGPYDHVILGFVSSRIPSEPEESDLVLDSSDPDFEQTGLKVSSVLRLHRMVTVTTSIIAREIGSLNARHQEQVNHRLRMLFDL